MTPLRGYTRHLLLAYSGTYKAGHQGVVTVNGVEQWRAKLSLALLLGLVGSELAEKLLGQVNDCKETGGFIIYLSQTTVILDFYKTKTTNCLSSKRKTSFYMQ